MFCPNCGKQVDDTALHCEACGAALDESAAGYSASPLPPKKSNNILIIVLLAVILVLVFFVALLVFKDKGGDDDTAPPDTTTLNSVIITQPPTEAPTQTTTTVFTTTPPTTVPTDPPPRVTANPGAYDPTYLIPGSDSRYLTQAEVDVMTTEWLIYSINEIYARKGYIFNDSDFANYFLTKTWYVPSVPSSQFNPATMFNSYEQYNVNLLKQERKTRG